MLVNDLGLDWACMLDDLSIILAQHKQTRKKAPTIIFATDELDTLWYTALDLLSGRKNLQILHIWHNHQALQYSLWVCLVSDYNWLWYYTGMSKLLQAVRIYTDAS